MARLTRSGVCYDLRNSPYKYQVNYNNQEITYCFSSEVVKQRFISKLNDNRETTHRFFEKKYGFLCVFNKLADITLYSKTEIRGFCIVVDGEVVLWQEKVKFVGEQLTIRS